MQQSDLCTVTHTSHGQMNKSLEDEEGGTQMKMWTDLS